MALEVCFNNIDSVQSIIIIFSKIADFGVSEQIVETDLSVSRWAGTPAFLAPETLCK